jgi:hypothetical protein
MRQNLTNDVPDLLCDHDDTPCETLIQSAPHLEEEHRDSRHL